MTTTAGQMVNTTVNGTAGNVTTTAAYVDPFFGNRKLITICVVCTWVSYLWVKLVFLMTLLEPVSISLAYGQVSFSYYP